MDPFRILFFVLQVTFMSSLIYNLLEDISNLNSAILVILAVLLSLTIAVVLRKGLRKIITVMND